jgi:L-lysine exporter family protein LysE/ArgO
MSSAEVLIFFNGLLISLGLIVAIGPQNAYVLRKGLKGRHVLAVATTCFLSDALLIALAVGGAGKYATESPLISEIAAWGGAAFLFWFGWQSLKSAKNPETITELAIEQVGESAQGKGALAAIGVALALTFFNPHVYFDTLIILGGLAAQYEDEWARTSFGVGAILGSALWFYGIGYGARFLAPVFREPNAWRILDLIITFIMWSVAAALVWGQLAGDHIH